MLCQLNVQTTAGSSCKCVLLLTVIAWTGPGVGAAEEKLNVRIESGVTPREAGTKQVSQGFVIDSCSGIGVAAKIPDEPDQAIDVVFQVTGSTITVR